MKITEEFVLRELNEALPTDEFNGLKFKRIFMFSGDIKKTLAEISKLDMDLFGPNFMRTEKMLRAFLADTSFKFSVAVGFSDHLKRSLPKSPWD